MPHTKRVMLWLLTVFTLLALVLPVSAGPDEQQENLPTLRFHTDGWLSDVLPAERDDALNRLHEIFEADAARIERRPPVDVVKQSQTTADWTIMVFIAGDNNLEGAALFDINEMELVGSSPDVNVLVQLDRSTDYVDWEGDWTGGRRYFIQQDQDEELINSTLLEDMGEINSGDPAGLVDFATWGISTYPAEKYMLVMWDHGGAWTGHASDEESGDEFTLPELRDSLDQIVAESGIGQFEVVGFDMCLMGQLEVFQTIAPYARYGLGAEETEPGPGWYYTFLDEVVQNPTMDGAELTTHVVDYYMTFYDEVWGLADLYDLSAVDFSQIGGVIEAVDQFAAAIEANPQAALSPVADARNNALSYGGNDDPRYYDVWSSVDLVNFAELLGEISSDANIQQVAAGLTSAVEQFVIHSRHNPGLEGSNGLSIYFPVSTKAYKTAGFNERYPVEAPASMASWIKFLDVFHGTAEQVVTAPGVNVLSVFPQVASIYEPAVVTMEVSGRDILQVNYAVTRIINENERVALDFDYLVSRTTTTTGADIVDWSNGVTTRTFVWEGEVPVLTDGTVSTYALLIPNRDDPTSAIVNGEYTSVDGGDPIQAQLVFDLELRQSTALWGINETASGTLQPFEIQVQAGDQFRPLWLTMDANNELSSTSFGDTLTLGGEQPITFEKVPAPSGSYVISFVAENVAGEKTLAEAVFEVANEGLDAAQRGYTDLNYGVNFRYPANWIRPRFTPDGKRLFTGDLATDTLMSLYPYTGVSSAEETDAALRESWNTLDNLEIVDSRQVEINGLPAYVTDYTYTFNGAGRVGAVIAIYVPDQGVGYAFDLDAPAENPGPAQEALAALVESINFFNPAAAVGESTWQTVTAAGGEVSFPLPATWVATPSGSFTLYGPANDETTFVALGAANASGLTKEELAEQWLAQLQTNEQNVEVLASEPYYVGSREWHLVVFTYEGAVKIAGAFFVTTVGDTDYTFWLEAPDAAFDQLYSDIFKVTIDGFEFVEE